MMNGLAVEALSWSAAEKSIVDAVTFAVEPGEFVGIVGPNGSGKSTLLRMIYRVLRPASGRVVVGSGDVWALSARHAAMRTAVVAQERPGEFYFTDRELVAMGRNPHKSMFSLDNSADTGIIETAMRNTGIGHLATRRFAALSGGEKQRVLMARALAQQAAFLVLDEPTNHLDIRYQLELLGLVRSLGITTLAALHDLNLAARYCHRIVVLKDGRIAAAGAPREVLTAEIIEDVYRVAAEVSETNGYLRIGFEALPGGT